ncbi:MAG TPA: hypothetical protein VH208_08930 [Myxococcaceae bacterium]|nr:hypothetical protein [Myxococcaceae bacterium]
MLPQLVALWAAVAAAGAGDREAIQACIAASTRGQELRDSGDLLGARSQFQACAGDACPKAIRTDCARWEADIAPAVPSLVFGVREGSTDVEGAEVSVDGKPVRLDGRPVELNPGPHQVRASRGDTVKEMPLTVYAGEHNRLVIVPWESTARAEPVPLEPPKPAREPPPATAEVERAAPAATRPLAGPLALAGVGTAGIVVFAALGASGENQLNVLKASGCGQTQTCAPGTTDPVRTQFIAADISLGVGIAAIAGAALWYFTGTTSNAVSVWSDGRSISVAGGFAF